MSCGYLHRAQSFDTLYMKVAYGEKQNVDVLEKYLLH
jgi:hypothetical protein